MMHAAMPGNFPAFRPGVPRTAFSTGGVFPKMKKAGKLAGLGRMKTRFQELILANVHLKADAALIRVD